MRLILDYNPRLRRLSLSTHSDRSFDWIYDHTYCDIFDYDRILGDVISSFRKLQNKEKLNETH